MATFRTKSPDEARRFISSLVARGFRQIDMSQHLRALPVNTFRVYRERTKPKPTKWIRVSYYEPRRGPFTDPPEFGPPQPRGAVVYCRTKGHNRILAYSKHLCPNCYHRAQYWAREAIRDRNRARLAFRRTAQEHGQQNKT